MYKNKENVSAPIPPLSEKRGLLEV